MPTAPLRPRALAVSAALALTTAVTGGLASLATSASADPGSYTSTDTPPAVDGSSTPAASSISVPDTISSPASVAVTVHGFTTSSVSNVMLTLAAPGGSVTLLCDPATVAGSTSASGADVTFNSNGTGEQTCNGDLGNLNGQPATGTWTLTLSDNDGTTGTPQASISGWALAFTEAPQATFNAPDPVNSGTDATFSLSGVEGVPAPAIQWQVSTDGGTTFTDIAGANGTSYTVTAPTTAQNNNAYQAVLTNSAGSLTAGPGTLYVNQTAPVVTTQPASTSVVAGNTATFTAGASGDPAPTVQWQNSIDGGKTFLDIPGATSDSYTIPADNTTGENNGDEYQAVFSNDAGEVTSNPATLTVTGTAPSAPQHVTAAQTGAGAVTIAWRPSTSQGSSPIKYYVPGYSEGQMGNGDAVPPTKTSDTFSHLQPGKYIFSVAAVNAYGSSARVNVPVTVGAPTKVPTATVSTRTAVAGAKVTLSGQGPANARLTLQRALPGHPFTALTTVKTNAWGHWSSTQKVTSTATYRAVSGSHHSNTVKVSVASHVTISATRTGTRTYRVSGTVAPGGSHTVKLVATIGGHTATVGSAHTDKSGRYTAKVTFKKAGSYTVKAVASSTAANTAGTAVLALAVK